MSALSAPTPPGRLGEAADPAALATYLEGLRLWLSARKNELDGLDAAALGSATPETYTADITLAMSLWQSVAERLPRLQQLWDSGRAGIVEREQMSQVIWGRRGDGSAASGSSLSLVEATRLCDALAGQLRVALSFDPSATDAARRVAALRASMERLRELVKQEPGWSAQVELLGSRIDDAATRAARGGDVSGLLATLEVDSATAERDLVVTTAKKLRQARSAAADAATLAQERERTVGELEVIRSRRAGLLALAAQCRAEIVDAPRYAIPDVDALGEIPSDRSAYDDFTARLGAVVRAMGVVEQAYGEPLRELAELKDLYAGYQSMAAQLGGDPTVSMAERLAAQTLAGQPVHMEQVRTAVFAYRDMVRAAVAAASRAAATGSLAAGPPPMTGETR